MRIVIVLLALAVISGTTLADGALSNSTPRFRFYAAYGFGAFDAYNDTLTVYRDAAMSSRTGGASLFGGGLGGGADLQVYVTPNISVLPGFRFNQHAADRFVYGEDQYSSESITLEHRVRLYGMGGSGQVRVKCPGLPVNVAVTVGAYYTFVKERVSTGLDALTPVATSSVATIIVPAFAGLEIPLVGHADKVFFAEAGYVVGSYTPEWEPITFAMYGEPDVSLSGLVFRVGFGLPLK